MTADQDPNRGEQQMPNEHPRKHASAIDGRLTPELLARLAATLNADKESPEAGQSDTAGGDE